jgi:phytoene dehydrogenase-like protein
VLLHHVFGEVNGKKGAWGHAIGGMGAITQAMRREAEARGVEIRTGEGVARILVEAAAPPACAGRRHEVAARCVVLERHPRALLALLDERRATGSEPFAHTRASRRPSA